MSLITRGLGTLGGIISRGLFGTTSSLTSSPISVEVQTWGETHVSPLNVIRDIRQMFGLSGKVQVERKKKRQIVGDVLNQLLHDRKFFGNIYSKVDFAKNLYGYNYFQYSQEMSIEGLVYKSSELENKIEGLVYNKFNISEIINGRISHSVRKRIATDGKVLRFVRHDSKIRGNSHKKVCSKFIVKGYVEKSLTKKNILALMDIL